MSDRTTNELKVYLIGSLKNQQYIPELANRISKLGYEAFADWIAPGPEADDFLLTYSKIRGRNYKQTLQSYAAQHVFEFDKYHIDRADIGILVMPAGKSGHLELGYMAGRGKHTVVYFAEGEPSRVDVMYNFSDEVCFTEEELIRHLNQVTVIRHS